MTISEILPKNINGIVYSQKSYGKGYMDGHKQAIYDCHVSLTKAFNDGTLCWRPSEMEIYGAIVNSGKCLNNYDDTIEMANSILNLLKQWTTQ